MKSKDYNKLRYEKDIEYKEHQRIKAKERSKELYYKKWGVEGIKKRCEYLKEEYDRLMKKLDELSIESEKI